MHEYFAEQPDITGKLYVAPTIQEQLVHNFL